MGPQNKMKIQNHLSSPGNTEARNISPAGPGSLPGEEQIELEDHVREPDIEDMEVDTKDWRMRDRVDLARRRAAPQRKILLAELEANEKQREELQELFRQDILETWEKEQWSFMTGMSVKDTSLVIKAKWNPDLDSNDMLESG